MDGKRQSANKNPPVLREEPAGRRFRVMSVTGRTYLLAGAGLLAVVVAGLAAEEVLVLFFLLVGLVLLDGLVLLAAVLALAEEPAGEADLVAWAANVRGIVATARAIVAKNVFFIFFLPAGLLGPLTIPSCGGLAFYSIACAGYRRHRIRGYWG
jgi:hypothetical protein